MSVGHGEKLSRKASQAIAALLEKPTIAEAAQNAGVNERTLRRWLEREDFRDAYKQAADRSFNMAIARLRGLADRAVQTLNDALDDSASPLQVRAALGIVEHATRATHDEILDRIEALEQREMEHQ